jgi:hypothetical protein
MKKPKARQPPKSSDSEASSFSNMLDRKAKGESVPALAAASGRNRATTFRYIRILTAPARSATGLLLLFSCNSNNSHAVAHASLRNFLCNAAFLHHVHHPLSPHKAALSNADQSKIVSTCTGFEILFFNRSEAAVLAAGSPSTSCQQWQKGRARLCCCD